VRPHAEAELETLYRRYRADVYRYALSASRDENEADEVTQAAFLSAYRALARGGRPRQPRAWLLAIAENVRRRRLRRPRESPLPDSYEAPVSEPDVTGAELMEAIEALPEPQRRALLLRELGGRSYDEIAGELETSVGAVQMLLFRARRELRERLKRVAAFPAPFWVEGGAGSAGPALRAAAVALGAVTLALGSGGAAPPAPAIAARPDGRLVAPLVPTLPTATRQTQQLLVGAPAAAQAARTPVQAPAQKTPAAQAEAAAAPAPGSAAAVLAEAPATSPPVSVELPLALPAAPAAPAAPDLPVVPAVPVPTVPSVPAVPAVPEEEAPLELPALPELPPLPEAPALPEPGGAQLP
jgi:RNA polymerase sigma factor (sigma-70 family)